jgi:hypothetical protein
MMGGAETAAVAGAIPGASAGTKYRCRYVRLTSETQLPFRSHRGGKFVYTKIAYPGMQGSIRPLTCKAKPPEGRIDPICCNDKVDLVRTFIFETMTRGWFLIRRPS